MPKQYVATVHILMPIDVRTQTEADDWISGLLTENSLAQDWAHLDGSPREVLVPSPDTYTEGDFIGEIEPGKAPEVRTTMGNPMPWLWLEGEDKETQAIAACGCRLVRDYEDSGDPAFFMCAAHQAALTHRDTDAERTCALCRHFHTSIHEGPCSGCTHGRDDYWAPMPTDDINAKIDAAASEVAFGADDTEHDGQRETDLIHRQDEDQDTERQPGE